MKKKQRGMQFGLVSIGLFLIIATYFYFPSIKKDKILNVCSKKPVWISDSDTALSAIEKMNNLKITSLLVAREQDIKKKNKNVIGILHLHHCLSRGIKWKKIKN